MYLVAYHEKAPPKRGYWDLIPTYNSAFSLGTDCGGHAAFFQLIDAPPVQMVAAAGAEHDFLNSTAIDSIKLIKREFV